MDGLFDDAEPEDESLIDALEDIDQTFRIYVREGLHELQDWLREQPTP